MKTIIAFVLMFLMGCSPPTTINQQSDWSVVEPTSWHYAKEPDVVMQLPDGHAELIMISPVGTGAFSVVTFPWTGTADAFSSMMLLSIHEAGYKVLTAHAVFVGGNPGIYVLYEVTSNLKIHQLNVGHHNHGHVVTCAIVDNDELSEKNCVGSLDTFRVQ